MELLLYHWENGPDGIRTRICDCDRVPCSLYTTGPDRSFWNGREYDKIGREIFLDCVPNREVFGRHRAFKWVRDDFHALPSACLKGSVPTGNLAEPRLTSGAFAFLRSTAEDPRARGNRKTADCPAGHFSKSVRSGAPGLLLVLKYRLDVARAVKHANDFDPAGNWEVEHYVASDGETSDV